MSFFKRLFKRGSRTEKKGTIGYESFKDVEKNKKSSRNTIKRQDAFYESPDPETKISPSQNYEINEEYVPGSQQFRVSSSDSNKYPGLNLEIVRKTPDNTIAAGLKKRKGKKTKKNHKKHSTQKNNKNSKKTYNKSKTYKKK